MIPDPVAIAAIETILKPLGTSLKHYQAVHKAAAIEAMRGVLMAERERAAGLAERVSAITISRVELDDHTATILGRIEDTANNRAASIAAAIRGEG